MTRDIDPRLLVAAMYAFALGFKLFEPFIVKATGLDNLDPEEVKARIVKIAAALVQPRRE